MPGEDSLQSELLEAFRWIEGHADVWRFFTDAVLFGQISAALAQPYRTEGITKVAGIESRGFILGATVAHELTAGFVAIRKPGTLFPGQTLERTTERDYRGRALPLRIQRDSLSAADRVLLVDDWLETGRQAQAARGLVEDCGATFAGISVIVDDLSTDGRGAVGDFHALIRATDLGDSSA